MNADGSGEVQLTSAAASQGQNFEPAWSPDGSKIAFLSGRDGQGEIYVMNGDGSGQTRLTFTGSSSEGTPAWSPDGSKIGYSRFDFSIPEQGFWIMNADGTNQTRLTSSSDAFPSWSPDGSKIAFQSGRDGDAEIYAMNADGTGQTNLTESPLSNEGNPDWSPDGTKIVFWSNRDRPPGVGGADIYVMNANGTGLTRLTFSGLDDYPAFSPDGSKIAFATLRDFNEEIYVMNADGSAQTRVTNNAAPGNTLPEDFYPTWQAAPSADTVPPTLNVPAAIIVDATTQGGAVVPYSVTATDDVDPTPTVACDPAPGSTFAIGTTTVNCTASDASGNAASASFTVHVEGAPEQVADLIALVDSYNLGLLGTALHEKLTKIQGFLAANKPKRACEVLDRFLAQVKEQRGKRISVERADRLALDAQQIKTVIGC